MKKGLWLIGFLFLVVAFAKAQNDTVVFSTRGGFYNEEFALQLYNVNPQNHIRYTVNGNPPTAQSPLYVNSLWMDAGKYSISNIYTINNTIPSLFWLPDHIQRAIVIRAAVFDENDNCVSQVVTNSYFIRTLGCDFHGLPVLSIVTDSLSLFGYDTGIFVPGVNYDPADSVFTGNYWLKGIEWERQINMEFYEPDNSGINQCCGLRIHGGASRWFQQKGMKLYAREEYGNKCFFHRFFKESPVVKFKHLNLHPFRCSNWLHTGANEYLTQTIARQLDIDAMGVRQTVVFINGEYWGVYTLEESADEHYLKDHYNADLDSVTIIKYWGVPNYGDPTEWRAFLMRMLDADLTQAEDSAFAFSHVDVPSFIDYMLLEIFGANLDWPSNNVKISQMAPGAPFRWMLYDTDGCFTMPEYQAMQNALSQNTNSVVFSRFLDNREFRFQFCKRYEELSRTYFSYDYMKSVLEQYRQMMQGEVEAQSKRFGFPWNMNKWLGDMERTDEFLRQRDQYFREEIKDYLDIEELDPVIMSCYPNPFFDEINIRIKEEWQGANCISIYDMMGRQVFSQFCPLTEGENTVSIHPKLAAGVYVMKAGGTIRRIVKY